MKDSVDEEEFDFTGYKNSRIRITDDDILKNLQRIQRGLQIEPSRELMGTYNLSIEMETGVGKTYTYIKTMYELNKRFGFTKFIVVVPSIAIREGVYKSFQLTEDHFAEDYGKKIRYFIYNSKQLHKIDQFANDSGINVMIINSQAFTARGKDARRISMELDSFRSRKPIDIIAQTNPILIIDEPQSVEGPATKEALKSFNPLITLRYSATLRKGEIIQPHLPARCTGSIQQTTRKEDSRQRDLDHRLDRDGGVSLSRRAQFLNNIRSDCNA